MTLGSIRTSRTLIVSALLLAVAMVAGCTPAPPEPEEIEVRAAEFTEPIEPAWTIDDPDVFGVPVATEGVVAYYTAAAEALTLHVADATSGEDIWSEVVSPAGEFNVPLTDVGLPQVRKYDTPPPTPLIVNRGEGEDSSAVIVYFRPIEGQDNVYDRSDRLVVADVRTGEELTVALDDDWNADNVDSLFLRHLQGGTGGIDVVVDTSPMVCGEGPLLCWAVWNTYARLDLGTLTIELNDKRDDGGPLRPSFDSFDRTPQVALQAPDFAVPSEPWGQVVGMDVRTPTWQRGQADLFGPTLSVPTGWRWPLLANGGAIAPGYKGLDLDRDIPLITGDFAASRTAVAIDLATGETRWTLPGGDPLCYAVAGYPIDPDTDVVPMCLVTAGGFSFTPGSTTEPESPDTDVSIVGVNAADGSIAWEIEHAGDASLERINYVDTPVFRAVGQYTVAATEKGTMLIDLSSGETQKLAKDAQVLCQVEFEPVPLEPMRRIDSGEYDPGMAFDPCGADGSAGGSTSRGAVRLVGDGAGDGMVVVRSSAGLNGYDLSAD